MQKNAEPDADGEDISGSGAPKPQLLYPVLTNPTTGVTASTPMLGDIILASGNGGFAGRQ